MCLLRRACFEVFASKSVLRGVCFGERASRCLLRRACFEVFASESVLRGVCFGERASRCLFRRSCFEVVASESVLRGVCELRGDKNDEETCDIDVSCDGTWQRRGYSSLNGVLAIISVDTGKVIDYEVVSKKCAQCTSWGSRKDTEEYATYENQCLINHQGSAGTMESNGVVACFERSVDKYNVRYAQYLGDGSQNRTRKLLRKTHITVRLLLNLNV